MGRKGDENRRRIVDAAGTLFHQKGFGRSSLGDVARSVGLPKGNLYHYFPSKDALLQAVVEDRVERLEESLSQCSENVADPRERLKRLPYLQQVEDVHHFGCPYGTLTAELGKEGSGQQERAGAAFALLLAWTEEQYCALGFDDAAARARRHIARLQGAAVLAHAFGDPAVIEAEVAEVAAGIDRL